MNIAFFANFFSTFNGQILERLNFIFNRLIVIKSVQVFFLERSIFFKEWLKDPY